MLVARIGALVIEWVNAVGTASVDNFIVEFSKKGLLSQVSTLTIPICQETSAFLLINRNTR